jgi:hypothetical protein
MCKSHIISPQIVELISNIILISVIREDVNLVVSRKILTLVTIKILPELSDVQSKLLAQTSLAQVRIVFIRKLCSLKNKLFVWFPIDSI